MSYADFIRDRIDIQRRVTTSDGGFGQTDSWVTVLSIGARIFPLSGKELLTYQREGYQNVLRVACEDRIPLTSSTTSLRAMLQDYTSEQYRFRWQSRTLQIRGITVPLNGFSDTPTRAIYIDCTEQPMPVGDVDQ